jgi:hypothetical protein
MSDSLTERQFQSYLKDTGERIRFALALLKELKEAVTPERLREVNDYWYQPIEPEGYERDFANPDVAADAFGERPGQHLSSFRYDVFGFLSSAFHQENGPMEKALHTLEQMEKSGPNEIEPIVQAHYRRPDRDSLVNMLRRRFDPEDRYLLNTIQAADPEDLSYLYRHGMRVSSVQREIAAFLFSLPKPDLQNIAETLANAYLQGLKDERKDVFTSRKTVAVTLPMGGEALFPFIRGSLSNLGLNGHAAPVHRPPVNRQANYDHRFKYALFLDSDTVENQMAMRRDVFEELAPIFHAYSGVAYLELFGEKPFSPEPKAAMVRPDKEASALYNSFTQQSVMLQQKYIPRSETSFSMIAFPSPEIGDGFREIFRECVKVNTLSNQVYGPVQARLIDAMDGAERVRVTGAPGNDTELTIAIHPLSDPGQQTAFENCLASVNIPVGEVFTSPVLKGTNGLLHVHEAFLDGLKYENLRIRFRDGEALEWSCTNFEDPGKGKDYIRENIFFPHDSLPMGEFAIGTNTVAYAMGVRHRIMDVLPVLILEKMGPHFAVGDTCYSRSEDREQFDPVSGKRLVAVENERSALRGESPEKAYTNRHVDITLPYSDLDAISAVHPDGREVYLMRGGRFVLPGTEILNEPLEGLDD